MLAHQSRRFFGERRGLEKSFTLFRALKFSTLERRIHLSIFTFLKTGIALKWDLRWTENNWLYIFFLFSDALASLALMVVTGWLTHWSKLEISHVWQFSHHPSRILSGENICLVSLVILRNLQKKNKILAFCSASFDGFSVLFCILVHILIFNYQLSCLVIPTISITGHHFR